MISSSQKLLSLYCSFFVVIKKLTQTYLLYKSNFFLAFFVFIKTNICKTVQKTNLKEIMTNNYAKIRGGYIMSCKSKQ